MLPFRIYGFFWLMSMLCLSCQERQSKKLPRLFIHSDTPIDKKEKQDARLEYQSASDRFRMPATIKRRGGWSMRCPKHSYTLELGQDYPLAGLPIEDDWILNASYIDKTFLRNSLSYSLFRDMHPENYAPGSEYVRVYLNNDFKGLYILTERVDRKRLGIKKHSGGLLYKDPPIFHFPERVPFPENYFHQKYPKPEEDKREAEIAAFRTFLFEAPDSLFKDPENGIGRWIDLRNVIDWHLLILLSNNNDGIRKNFYLYRLSAADRFQITPWDYDHSFGRDGDGELNLIRKEAMPSRSVLIRRLLETGADDYPQQLQQRWHNLRKGLFSEASLQARIDSLTLLFREEIPDNAERWPYDGPLYYDDNEFRKEIKIMEAFIRLRLGQLDRYFSEPEYPLTETDQDSLASGLAQ
ncbi:MAG: hypothetical protein GYB31_08160 [Bacteroidetes bacterium]|nr:hypothetical protein [Bacteroidota bacterium]